MCYVISGRDSREDLSKLKKQYQILKSLVVNGAL